ncbi:hypothetical protein SAMN02745163_04431 [Clostridium cavendishii DSM 21758]|uniref:Uncharacterized protein n=1 Tax=Clostridium cavendishii DSM 21758 TaxID=1121302 RepID=A0A1M6V6V1_9CLOT|nr:hypothetical protein [Clostridium cavendishii]SHK77046.1 hypothetical protein SAMN02745163_04431 [Clostridium cavendishii DSM 21758]
MAYDITDIIDKAINIANKRKKIYIKIAETSNNDCVKVFSNVLVKNVDRNISYYETLKSQVTNNTIEEIGIDIYDKISFLINEFNNRHYTPEINNTKDFLKFSINFEKDIDALFIDIQGRLVKTSNDTDSITYNSLYEIIKAKENLIKSLEQLSKYN